LRSSSPSGAGLALLFAASGCAALILETTWLRWLRDVLGATAPAVSATLVAFFAGQALGAAAAGRVAARSRRPLALYGALELAAAAWAASVPLWLALGGRALETVYDAWLESPALLTAARFGLALAATLPASVCLGATLPAIGAAALGRRGQLATRATALYAVNLTGAVAGVVLAGVWLPPRIGVTATYALAIGLGAGVGGIAWLWGRGLGPREPLPDDAPARPDPRGPSPSGDRRLVALAAFSGFATFALQVLLVRAFALVLDQSVTAFAAVLAVVLVALAAGAAAVSALQQREGVSPHALLALGLAGAGLGVAAFPAVLQHLSGGLAGLDLRGTEAAPFAYGGAVLRLALGAAGLPLLAAGLAFPAVLAAASRSRRAPATVLGRLLAANTVGAIAGALAAPYLLLGPLGLWRSFGALAFAWALAAIFTPLESRRARLRRDLGLALGWALVLARASPFAMAPLPLEPGERLLDVSSGAAGVVAVVERGGERLLRSDAHYNLGGSADRAHQRRQGHLAAVLAPGAERVAWLGSATGISAGALHARPPESLALVELDPGVARAAARWFRPWNAGVHEWPQTRSVADDARSFVRATSARFDLVVGDLFVPWREGVGALYTREHFAAVRRRLAPGGAFVQWLPLYQLDGALLETIAATFADVFPDAVVFRGDFFGRFPRVALVGWAGAAPAPQAVARAARARGAAGVDDRWVTRPLAVWSLYVGPLAALPGLPEAPRNTAAWPRVEFRAARLHRGGGALEDAAVGLDWVERSAPLVRAAGTRADPAFPGLPEEARRAIQGGAALQTASALWSQGRREAAARHVARAAGLLPPSLLDPSRPDPTAAEVWPDPHPTSPESADPATP